MINIIGKRFLYLWISIILFVVALIFLGVYGLRPGVEFTSGTLLTLNFKQVPTQADLRQEMSNLGYASAIVQQGEGGDFLLRTPELTPETKAKLEAALKERFGEIEEREFTSVSPLVAADTARNAAIAVAVACVGILIYLLWAYRRIPHSFHYALCAILALVHDAVIIMGIFAVLGRFGWEINLMFITGVLAVIGTSVDNVVIIFDRIRENVRLGVSPDFMVIVNNSIVETLSRSLNFSLTIIFTLVAVMLFIGSSLQNFVVVMLVGVVAGVYSSLFVAPTMLVMWERKEWGKMLGRSPKPVKAA
jgi:preprotein translocase subunit SecF